MLLKKLMLCSVLVSSLLLSGCTGMSFTVDGLLGAPKLTEEQSEIHETLIEAVGGNVISTANLLRKPSCSMSITRAAALMTVSG